MTLTINDTFNSITIVSTKLDAFIATPSAYTNVQVIGELNCSGTTTTKTYSSTSLITSSTDVRTVAGVESIVPNFFGTTVFENGVYSFTVKLTTLAGSSSTEKACLFVDDGDILCAIPTDCLDKQMLYYTLKNTFNCGCDCTKLCEMLETISETTTNCNCQ